MENTDILNGNIAWFRQASPYINAHRGKTLVLYFNGKVLADDTFPTLIHDITLLSHLGVRLVLVYGLSQQIDAALQDAKAASSGSADKSTPFSQRTASGQRITDSQTLEIALAEVGKARVRIESLLSMGLPNTPMSGAHLSVASGNFVTAQPFGIHSGVDYCHTGSVRQIHATAIQTQLDCGHLVLLSPLGYSLTGEVFNLQSEEVALHAARALQAEKLIYLSDAPVHDAQGQTLRESSLSATREMLRSGTSLRDDHRRMLNHAIEACQSGIGRVHLLCQADPDALLKELYTRDGSGTLITADDFDSLRPAKIDDVGGIIELIQPLEENGTLIRRTREQLERDISDFYVSDREGMVTACAALIRFGQTAEVACVVTHPEYRGNSRAEKLLHHFEKQAHKEGITSLFALTTRTGHWFIEQGFSVAERDALPAERLSQYDTQRASKVFVKILGQ